MKLSRAIFWILLVTTFLSIGAMYYRFFVLQDFEIFYDDYGEDEMMEEGAELEIEGGE